MISILWLLSLLSIKAPSLQNPEIEKIMSIGHHWFMQSEHRKIDQNAGKIVWNYDWIFSINYDPRSWFNQNFIQLLQGKNWLNILSICCFVLMQLASHFNQKWLKIFTLSHYWLNSEMQKSYYNLEEARKWKGLAHWVSEHSKFKHFSYEVTGGRHVKFFHLKTLPNDLVKIKIILFVNLSNSYLKLSMRIRSSEDNKNECVQTQGQAQDSKGNAKTNLGQRWLLYKYHRQNTQTRLVYENLKMAPINSYITHDVMSSHWGRKVYWCMYDAWKAMIQIAK